MKLLKNHKILFKLTFLILAIIVLFFLTNKFIFNKEKDNFENESYDPAKAVQQAGQEHAQQEAKEYQQEISDQCPNGMDDKGYCLENNAKTKNNNPSNYNNKKSCDDAGYIWNNALKTCQFKLGPVLTAENNKNKKQCENEGNLWNSAKKICENMWPGKNGAGTQCGENKKWDYNSQRCVNMCPEGMKWDHKKKKCVNKKNNKKKSSDDSSDDSTDDSSNDSSDDISNDWNDLKSNLANFFKQSNNGNTENSNKHNGNNKHYYTDPVTGKKTFAGSYPASAAKQRHEIPPGDENLYILKSQIVPPVCPACPPVIQGSGCPELNAKCPPCPAPKPVPPCPPCERCPEPQFQCKKVPDYSNVISGNLPRPLLNDFSQF